jgi:hypothetical protein
MSRRASKMSELRVVRNPLGGIHGSEAAEPVQRLSALDERLHANWIDGAFVWHDALSHAFPHERFWWLYGRLRIPDE